MSELIKLHPEYADWIRSIGVNFKQFQIKAVSKVNEEMLRFYWNLGRDISSIVNRAEYGSKFYENLSLDLKKELPDVKAFSVTNLKYMKYYHDMYSRDTNNQQVVDDFVDEKIFCIPWGHQIQILSKCKGNQQKALFFVYKTIENNWSRAVLMNFLDTNLYERQGNAISNFDKTLPDTQSDLAQEMTKDPYNFDFLTLRQNYDEKELKDALMENVQSFLLELGTGFAFVGREYRLKVGETEQFIDMLFYNIINHCYVVVEIKTRDFEPGDMGQLGTYVAAVDGILRKTNDNQTVGLLICKTKDNILAKYAVNAVKVPIGISEYDMNNLIPEEYKSSMPTIEEIEKELK
ncbi:MAG: YhcG family protein [Roseburia sp.]